MKKQYNNPEMLIIKIGALPMLAGSKKLGVDPSSSVNPNLSDAPSFDWDDDEDDDY